MTSGEANSVRMKRAVRLLRELCRDCPASAETVTRGIVDRLDNEWLPTNAPRGDAGQHDNVDIAEGVGWLGDADQLVETLLEAGILATDDEHRLVRAEYHAVAPNYIRDKVRRLGGFVSAPADVEAKPRAKPRAKGDARNTPSPKPGAALSAKPSQAEPSPASLEWAEAEEEIRGKLRQAGVSAIDAAIAGAKARGATPPEVFELVAEWEGRAGAWDAGALFRRVVGQLAAWPPVSPTYNRNADAAARNKRQAAEAAERRTAVAAKAAASAAIDEELQRLEQLHGQSLDTALAAGDHEVDRLHRAAHGPAGGMLAASFRRRRASGQAMTRNERLDLLRAVAGDAENVMPSQSTATEQVA